MSLVKSGECEVLCPCAKGSEELVQRGGLFDDERLPESGVHIQRACMFLFVLSGWGHSFPDLKTENE